MVLGTIIKVDDANTYLGKIPPDSQKEGIGTLVKIAKDDRIIVGVIKNITHSIREEFIPYIEPGMQPKYTPFNEDFRNTYYSIHGLGTIQDERVRYEIDSPPDVKDSVEILSPEEIKRFHTMNSKPSIAYFHANRDTLDKRVLLRLAETIKTQYPECCGMLKLVQKFIGRE